MVIFKLLLECISEALSSFKHLIFPPPKSLGKKKAFFDPSSSCVKEQMPSFEFHYEIKSKESEFNSPSVVSKNNKNRVKKMPNQVHVVYNKEEKRWDIKRAGIKEPLDCRRLKLEAISVARSISKDSKSELVIHNRDGKIAMRDSHGNDPKKSVG